MRSPRVFSLEVPGAAVIGAEGDAQARPSANSADAIAYGVAKRAAPAMPEAQRQYVLAVARGEGFYGRGWKTGEGAGSHNWGAVQGTGPAGSFLHLDHHADGKPYHAPFKAYHNDEEGFLDMSRILLKPNVKQALTKGSLRDAVLAQHSNGYFELNPEKYLSAVLKNYDKLSNAVGWKRVLAERGITPAAAMGTGGAVVLGTGLYFGVRWLLNRKR